jgi:uncharacterized repeat protein (TIGR02543 family)
MATSNVAIITVNTLTNAQAPNISLHPQAATYIIGNAATALTVTATVEDGGTLSYQWYLNTSNSNAGGTAIEGAIAASYSPPTATLGAVWYYVVVTNTNAAVNGTQTANATSIAASVSVNPVGTTSHSITYLLNGGTNHPDNPDGYTSASPEIVLKAPTRTGYDFDGWTPAGIVPAGSAEDKTFSAGWSAIGYSISYELGGGTNHADNPDSYTVENVITLQDPLRTGYSFDGWAEGNGIAAGSTGDTTFTAQWTAVSYAISYELNGGVVSSEFHLPAAYTVEDEIDLGNNTEAPYKSGYSFSGWAEGDRIERGSTGDKTFTAQWSEAIIYAIAYVLDGGTNHPDNPESYTVESPKITLQEPKRQDYLFVDWTGGDSIPTGSTGDRTFTAQWLEIKIDDIPVDDGGVYQVPCDKTVIIIETGSATIPQWSLNGQQYVSGSKVEIPVTNVNSITVSVIAETAPGAFVRKEYSVQLAQPIKNANAYYSRWNDVIAVNMNPATNGGNSIADIRWYSNDGTPVSGVYSYLTGSINDYYAEVKIVGSEQWRRICPHETGRSLDRIEAYPNPVPHGESLTLKLPESYAGATLNIYDIRGRLVKSGYPLPSTVNSVNMSEFSSGVYLLRITDRQGNSETVKIINN